ncbi:hypothetical protein [Actinoallomurus sp. NPDC050550]
MLSTWDQTSFSGVTRLLGGFQASAAAVAHDGAAFADATPAPATP